MEPEIIIWAVIFAECEDDRFIFLPLKQAITQCRSPPDLEFAQQPNFRNPEEK